jgi:tartrate-resistant acid phosphatase type 5
MKLKEFFILSLFVLVISCDSNYDDGQTKVNQSDTMNIDTLDTLVADTSVTDTISEEPEVYGPPSDLKIITGAIHFYVFGDFGRGGEYLQKELGHMLDTVSTVLPPDFIISTGDNFYPDGVRSVTDEHWQGTFESIYPTNNGLNCPWYVVLGNHDYHLNPDAQIAYTDVSDRWYMPGYYFSKDYKGVDFSMRLLFMDTNPFIDKYYAEGKFKSKVVLQDTTAELSRMDSLFNSEEFTWKMVVGHHPVYSGESRGSELGSMQQHIMPHLYKNNVDVYFAGHEHVIRHLKKEGPTHFMTSGAGSKTVAAHDIPDTRFVSGTTAFLLVSVTSDSLYFQSINYKGEIEYRVSIIK